MSKTMICPNCKEILDKISIDYVVLANKTYDIKGKSLYHNDWDDELNTNDIYMIYCDKCGNELPKEIRDEIANFVIKN